MKFYTDIQFGSAQHRFVLIRWCTRRFCMFVIRSDRDGAQYDVVSLDGWLGKPLWGHKGHNLGTSGRQPACAVKIGYHSDSGMNPPVIFV